MDKSKLKETLLALEQQIIDQAELNYEEYLSSSQLDETEPIDDGEQSMARENADLSSKLDDQIYEHTEHLETLKGMDFSPADSVRPGAVVKTNNRYMFIGVSKPKFKFEDKQFIGVSADAPIYQCMQGRKAGDVCVFNNTKFEIQEIY
ncbi:MAG: hypothetical protein AAFO07_11875 [Bacteroidota bacterium]